MPRLFLTPFVIAGLLFLPSCSKQGTTMSCDEANARAEELADRVKNLLLTAENIDDDNDVNVLMAASFWNNRRFTILANTQCFTPLEIDNAQDPIE